MKMRVVAGVVLGVVSAVAVAQKSPRVSHENLDWGPNVKFFRPGMSHDEMQQAIDKVYTEQQHAEFGSSRYAFLLMPGKYNLDIPVGFYTQVLGLGASPDDVRVTGDVHADAASKNNNATTTFWRGVEGFSVVPAGGTMQWAVSQAIAARRMHVLGNMVLHQKRGWASGGWLSDSLVDGTVDSGTQQQWISRNTEWQQWTGANWNMVFVGAEHAPEGEWPKPPFTKIATVPIVREKPFLQVDAKGNFSVRVPAIRENSSGITWKQGATAGRNVPLSHFYIARPDRDTDVTINAALDKGKDLL
ncbi:MAG: coagulation factor 5/8 type domain-containing protein, partial [Acidobacteria bacterium]|nr:coagulation factor 5/8 type domain-containing protein [Acidobacteriota bacterium]